MQLSSCTPTWRSSHRNIAWGQSCTVASCCAAPPQGRQWLRSGRGTRIIPLATDGLSAVARRYVQVNVEHRLKSGTAVVGSDVCRVSQLRGAGRPRDALANGVIIGQRRTRRGVGEVNGVSLRAAPACERRWTGGCRGSRDSRRPRRSDGRSLPSDDRRTRRACRYGTGPLRRPPRERDTLPPWTPTDLAFRPAPRLGKRGCWLTVHSPRRCCSRSTCNELSVWTAACAYRVVQFDRARAEAEAASNAPTPVSSCRS